MKRGRSGKGSNLGMKLVNCIQKKYNFIERVSLILYICSLQIVVCVIMENQPVKTFPPTAVAEADPNFLR